MYIYICIITLAIYEKKQYISRGERERERERERDRSGKSVAWRDIKPLRSSLAGVLFAAALVQSSRCAAKN